MYVDGFVAAVPTANKDSYRAYAHTAAAAAPDDNPMPFDGARMIFGGFDTIVGP